MNIMDRFTIKSKIMLLLRVLIITVALFSYARARVCHAGAEEDALKFAIGTYNDGFYDTAEKGFKDFIQKYKHSKNRPYALYLLGVTKFMKDDYKGTKAIMTEMIQLYPKDERVPAAHYFLGEACYITDDYKGARKSYKQVYKKKPKGIARETVLFRLGELNFLADDFEGAKHVLGELTKHYKKYQHIFTARFYLAFSYYYTADHKNALGEFKYLLSKPKLLKNRIRDILYFGANSAFAIKKYKSAGLYYKDFLSRTKNDKRRPDARYFYAMSLYLSKDTDGALKEMKRYEKDYPKGKNISTVLEQLSQLSFEREDYKVANRYFEKLIAKYKKSPKINDWQLKSAWCYTNLDDHKKALAIYDEVGGKTKDKRLKLDIMFLSAESNYLIKEYKKALTIYEKLKGVKRYRKSALLKLANSHFYLNDYSAAIKYYSEYVKAYPKKLSNEIFMNFAISLQAEKRNKEALVYYEKLITQKNKSGYYKAALYNAAILYDEIGDPESLKNALVKYVALKDVEVPPYFYLKLATAYYESDEWDNAIKYYQLSMKSGEQSLMGAGHLKLAEIYYLKNNIEKSLEHFELAETDFPVEESAAELSLIYIKKANIYEKLSEWKLARDEYAKVAKISEDEKLIKIARDRIIEVEKKLAPQAGVEQE